MSFRRCQRSDPEGSFPELPYGMGDTSDSSSSRGGSSARSKRKFRLRRSFQALKCFHLWSKPGQGVDDDDNDKQLANSACPGLDVEDSWESGVAEEDFEVRTTSPPHSVDGAFDVSQALQAVPEEEEEEDEESQIPENNVEEKEEEEEKDAQSHGSKPSDYSSEFITDDSTETSGLPWDSSFSQHGSFETPEEGESRIGIRPFQLPLDLGRILKSEKMEEFNQGQATEQSQSVASANKGDEPNDSFAVSSKFGRETFPQRRDDTGGSNERQRSDSSDSYSDELRDVFKVLEDTRSTKQLTGETRSAFDSEGEDRPVKPKPVKPKPSYFAIKLSEVSNTGNRNHAHSPTKASDRAKDLLKKYGNSPERQQSTPPRARSFSPESPISTASSLSPLVQPIEVPSEIIRYDNFRAKETKGFFWRSHPAIPNQSSKGDSSGETDLVDTSISTVEGNRSLDYSDVFTPEELQREYSASGEPSFIHI